MKTDFKIWIFVKNHLPEIVVEAREGRRSDCARGTSMSVQEIKHASGKKG